MILYHIIILAIIQGITEFLPVSSSGHLGLFHCFTDHCRHWDSTNLAMDVAVHSGTLMSVLLYFRHDVFYMIKGAAHIAASIVKNKGPKKINSNESKLLLYLLTSSAPVIIAGLALHLLQPDWLKTLHVIAWTTLIFGIVLWYADKKPAAKTTEKMTYKDAILIGISQILALIPGVSRSGITMTAARFLGYSRSEAARYSLLLAMVAISGAGALIGIDLLKSANTQLGIDVLTGIFFSFISGFIAISAMMKFIEKASFTIFAIYRIALGSALLALLHFGIIG